MNEKKSIICVCCGKRFYVDEDEYQMRRQESLCDDCGSDEEDDGVEMVRQIGDVIGRCGNAFVRTVDRLRERKEEKDKKNQEDK